MRGFEVQAPSKPDLSLWHLPCVNHDLQSFIRTCKSETTKKIKCPGVIYEPECGHQTKRQCPGQLNPSALRRPASSGHNPLWHQGDDPLEVAGACPETKI